MRTLTPSKRYLGDLTSGTFSVARCYPLQSILSPKVDTTLAVLGFPGSPRYIEPQIGPGDSTDWPFFYEDKRNQFYVSIATSFVPYNYWAGFGPVTAAAPPITKIPYIPPLTTTQFVVGGGPDPALVGPTVNQGPGAAWAYAGAGRNLVAGFANQAPFSFLGAVTGITADTLSLSPANTIHTQRGRPWPRITPASPNTTRRAK